MWPHPVWALPLAVVLGVCLPMRLCALLLVVELAMASVPLLLSASYLPSGPSTLPSTAVSLTTTPVGWHEWLQRIKAAVSHRPMLALATIAGGRACFAPRTATQVPSYC